MTTYRSDLSDCTIVTGSLRFLDNRRLPDAVRLSHCPIDKILESGPMSFFPTPCGVQVAYLMARPRSWLFTRFGGEILLDIQCHIRGTVPDILESLSSISFRDVTRL